MLGRKSAVLLGFARGLKPVRYGTERETDVLEVGKTRGVWTRSVQGAEEDAMSEPFLIEIERLRAGQDWQRREIERLREMLSALVAERTRRHLVGPFWRHYPTSSATGSEWVLCYLWLDNQGRTRAIEWCI
jgi:hypothetical protein